MTTRRFLVRRALVLFLVGFFVFGSAGQAVQEQKQEESLFAVCGQRVCILPPLVGAPPSGKPSKEFIGNLRRFHGLYTENLRKDLLISGQPKNIWWVIALLRPGCKNKKWCIEVNVAEEKKGAKHILITQIFLSEGESFDAGAEAEKAAKKTKTIILSVKKP